MYLSHYYFILFSAANNLTSKKHALYVVFHVQLKWIKKHPDRWTKNSGVLCRTADRVKTKHGEKRKSFKEVLLEVYYKRGPFSCKSSHVVSLKSNLTQFCLNI